MSKKFSLKSMLRVYKIELPGGGNIPQGGGRPESVEDRLKRYDADIVTSQKETKAGRLPEMLNDLIADKNKYLLDNRNTSAVNSYLLKNHLEIKDGKVSKIAPSSIFSGATDSSSKSNNKSIFNN